MKLLKITFLALFFFLCSNVNSAYSADEDVISSSNKTVKFSNLEDAIVENIKLNIASDDFYGVKNVFLNKKGSLKKFSLLQAKSSNIQDDYALADFTVDEVKQSFKATLKHSEKPIEIEVSGKFQAQIEVPVVVSSLSKGSIISDTDLKIILMDKNRLKQQAITTPERLIGKKLTRTLASGTTISFKDIEEPIIVEKGKSATILYKYKNIELKTIAEALENGADGQIIKFKNPSSDKIINAMVTSSGNAIVNYSNTAELAGNENAEQVIY
jgi:flagella basal body P-ring formation protein FlgA